MHLVPWPTHPGVTCLISIEYPSLLPFAKRNVGNQLLVNVRTPNPEDGGLNNTGHKQWSLDRRQYNARVTEGECLIAEYHL
jgi:hypothetical protein